MIKLGRMTDYGVVIMSEMTKAPGKVLNAPDLCLQTGLTVPTVAKILRLLGRGGLLESQRGAHGGYVLNKSAADISIADIVHVMEGPVAVTSCVDTSSIDCSVETSCPMRGGWEKINRAINAALEEVTLADMTDSENLLTGGKYAPSDEKPAASNNGV